MRACVKDAFPQIEEPQLTRLAAVAQLINSAYGWAVMQQHWDLDGTEAGLAASEALTILLGLKPAGDATRHRCDALRPARRHAGTCARSGSHTPLAGISVADETVW